MNPFGSPKTTSFISRTATGHCRRTLSCLALLAAVPAQAFAQCEPNLQPFQARYELLRDGNRLGTSTVRLEPLADDRWRYSLSSDAERGLFGLLGAGYSESSVFRIRNGTLQPLEYEREQHVAFSGREYSARYDWTTGSAQGKARDRAWQIDNLPAGTMDRLLVNLRLVADLNCGVSKLAYSVQEKGRVEQWHFQRRGPVEVETPAGDVVTVKIAKEHDDPERVSISWHAPSMNWLAVKIEHQDDAEEDRYTMVLKAYAPEPIE